MPAKSAQKKSKHWKTFQSDKKTKEKTQLAIVVLLLIVLTIIIGQTYRFISSFHQPKTPHLTSPRSYIWNKDFPLNVVVQNSSGEIGVLSFDPAQGLVSMLSIPDGVKIGDGNTSSAEALKKSLSPFLGLPMDGYIETTGELGKQPVGKLASIIRKNPFEAFSVYMSTKTDLTPSEFISLIYFISNVRFDKIQEFDLASLGLVEEVKEEDGKAVLGVSTAKLDTFMAQNFQDKNLREEQATIAIFNATSTPGLAAKLSRIITNLGGNVIFASNASTTTLSKSYVTSKEAPEYSSKRLEDLFAPNCQKEAKCDILEDSDITTSRAQINIVIGSDAINKY